MTGRRKLPELLPTGTRHVTCPRIWKRQQAGIRLTSLMGTVRADGEKLTFVTDQRAWNVDNPEILNGHEGHYVHAKAYVYPDKDSIHIVEVKMPTASETEKDDMK